MYNFWVTLIILFTAFTNAYSDEHQNTVYYINSYHEGYGSSDDITTGIKNVLKDQNIDLHIFYMDTKRNADQDFIKKQTAKLLNPKLSDSHL